MSGIDLVAAALAGEGITLSVVCQREGGGHLAPAPRPTLGSVAVAVGDGYVKATGRVVAARSSLAADAGPIRVEPMRVR